MNQSLSIYRASAGSGKTFALAIEYIKALLKPGAEQEFKHTLAVTFTNKATAEMKSRILETLYGLKMGLKGSRKYMNALKKRFAQAGISITEEQVREQAGKALTAILHDYSHFRVETIDSFFQSILRNMARELGLAANLQVELSHDDVIDNAVEVSAGIEYCAHDYAQEKRAVHLFCNERQYDGYEWRKNRPCSCIKSRCVHINTSI